MVQQSDGWIESEKGSGEGRRIIASCDGGRIRLRENKRGRKTKKGRTRYKGAWREPKLLIIYMVDAEGKKIKEYAPLIDGTLQGQIVSFALGSLISKVVFEIGPIYGDNFAKNAATLHNLPFFINEHH